MLPVESGFVKGRCADPRLNALLFRNGRFTIEGAANVAPFWHVAVQNGLKSGAVGALLKVRKFV